MIINKFYSDVKRELFNKRKQFLNQNQPDVDLLFFGDSILQGFDCNRFGGSEKYIINSAIGGDTLDYMASRFEDDALYFQPKEILFLGGINDIRKWYNETRSVEEIDELVDEIVTKYMRIIEQCLNTGINVYPCLLLLNAEEKNNFPFLNMAITQINQNLICRLSELELEYIDFNQVLSNNYGFLSRDCTDDGLHPNDYGNFEMYKILREKEIL